MDNNRQSEEAIEIDLGEIFHILMCKLVWIILAGVLFAAGAFLISEFALPPIYESTTKIYILNKQENAAVTYSDVQIGTQLTKDYAELVKGRVVLEDVIKSLELSVDYEELVKKINITTPTDTRILAISVEDTDPASAMKIADAIREAASLHITNVMDIKAVNVVEPANYPEEKEKPHVLQWTVIGGLLGILLVCALVLIRYLLDDTIKTSEDVEKYLQLSTLALIPMTESRDAVKKKKGKKPPEKAAVEKKQPVKYIKKEEKDEKEEEPEQQVSGE